MTLSGTEQRFYTILQSIQFTLCSVIKSRTLFIFSVQGSFTVMGVVSGPLLGVFILGMFFPATNRLVSCLIFPLVCTVVLLSLLFRRNKTMYKLTHLKYVVKALGFRLTLDRCPKRCVKVGYLFSQTERCVHNITEHLKKLYFCQSNIFKSNLTRCCLIPLCQVVTTISLPCCTW